MSERNFKILGAAAGASFLIALIVGLVTGGEQQFTKSGDGFLVSDIDIDQVSTIEIKSKDGKVRLERKGEKFLVASRFNYPADTKAINRLVDQILGIRVKDELTNNEANYPEMGLTDEAADSFKFMDKDGRELLAVYKNELANPGKIAKHVLRTNMGKEVYESERSLHISMRDIDYAQKRIVDIKTADIDSIAVQGAKDSYAIKNVDKKLTLQNIPAGKQAKETDLKNVADAASKLDFAEFYPASEKTGLKYNYTYTLLLKNKAKYTLKLAKQDDKYWLRISGISTVGQMSITQTESDEELKKKTSILQARDDMVAFNSLHQGWIYELPKWVGDRLTKDKSELLEDAPKVEGTSERPSELAASHILIAYEGAMRSKVKGRTKEQAKKVASDLLKQVKLAPEKFAELAKKHSACSSAQQGGNLGKFKFEAMAKEFSTAAFALPVGGISAVTETPFGFHIIKRTE